MLFADLSPLRQEDVALVLQPARSSALPEGMASEIPEGLPAAGPQGTQARVERGAGLKGRKPKYDQKEIAEVAARLASGESASAIASEKGWPRTSVLRCADSVRVPAVVKEKAHQAVRDRKASRRERLFWRFVEAYMRQGIQKASHSVPKEIATMLEASVKLRSLMTSSSTTSRGSLIHYTDETIVRFERFIKGEKVVIPAVDAGPISNLGGPKGDAIEAATDGAPPGEVQREREG